MANTFIELTIASRSAPMTLRFDENDQAMVSVKDLKAQKSGISATASADKAQAPGLVVSGNGDGWVSEEELGRTQGLNAGDIYAFRDLVRRARLSAFSDTSISYLKSTGAPLPSEPYVMVAPTVNRFRKDYPPLATYLAGRIAQGESYDSPAYGLTMGYFDATDVVKKYSLDEIGGALSVLALRNGMEIALCRKEDAQGTKYFIVTGEVERVVLHEEVVGTDLIFHTHPGRGAEAASPSTGDIYAARVFDADKKGGAVSEDGWKGEYSINSQQGVDTGDPYKLWR